MKFSIDKYNVHVRRKKSPNFTSKLMGLISTSQEFEFVVMIDTFIKYQFKAQWQSKKANQMLRITREETKNSEHLCAVVSLIHVSLTLCSFGLKVGEG